MEDRRKGQSWHLTTRLVRCSLDLPCHAHNVYKLKLDRVLEDH